MERIERVPVGETREPHGIEQGGRVYYDRKRMEGKTHRAARRALTRQLATMVFYRLKLGAVNAGAGPTITSDAA